MLSKSSANTIYRAYKHGYVSVNKKFINAMYKVVDMDEYALRHESDYRKKVAHRAAVAAAYIWDNFTISDERRRYEIAQAIIDGKEVEQVTVHEVIREFEVTQDVLDNPESYDINDVEVLFYKLGDTYTEDEYHIDYVIS